MLLNDNYEVEMVWRGGKLAEYAAWLNTRYIQNSPTAILCFILEFNNFAKEIRIRDPKA